MAYENLLGLFATNLVELAAVRRHYKPGRTGVRVFLATNNRLLLNGIAAKTALGFRAPTHPPPYNAKAHNLFVAYDLWMQGYRAINLNEYMIRGVLPLKNKNDIEDFWAYFAYVLKPMSTNEKIQVLDNRGYNKFSLDGIQEFMQKKREEERIQNYNSLIV